MTVWGREGGGERVGNRPKEVADLATTEVPTTSPPEIATSGHTYIRYSYYRHIYNMENRK